MSSLPGLYEDVQTVSCDTGFTAGGSPSYQMTCSSDGSWGGVKKCTGIIVQDIINSKNPIIRVNYNIRILGTFSNIVSDFACFFVQVYVMQLAAVTCQTPCVPNASSPPVPGRYGDVHVVYCDSGYTSNGTTSFNITCSSDRSWQGLKNCTRKQLEQ